jgi:hypothetical protein
MPAMRSPPRLLPWSILALLAASCGPSPAAAQVEIIDVGRYNFTGGGNADPRLVAEELSGLARVEGDRYVAVGDDHAALYFLDIAIDPESGRVRSVSFGHQIPILDFEGRPLTGRGQGADREDVVYNPEHGTVWLADERDFGDVARPSLVELDPGSGRELSRLVPAGDGPFAVYAAIRANYGFEALALDVDDQTLWTANEEALTIDGPLASPSTGSIVRLQELDIEEGPGRQVAYVTDPIDHAITGPPGALGEDRSGVSALVPIGDDRLLVLERGLVGDPSGMAGFRIRIHLAELDGATDVSAPGFRSGLTGRNDWRPARKALLFERRFGLPVSNFEGMAFGPRLSNGDRSLLLIADNGGGTWQSIYALRLREEP